MGLNLYQYLIGLTTSPDCLYCPGTREVIQHYLLHCSCQVLLRDKLYRRLNSIWIREEVITVSLLLSGLDLSRVSEEKYFCSSMIILKILIKMTNCESGDIHIYLENSQLSYLLEVSIWMCDFVYLLMLLFCFLSDVVIGDMFNLNHTLAFCWSSKTNNWRTL